MLQSRKQSFIVAVLVILLCFACVTGATLALFTSNLNDGTVGVVTTAGNVDVDIVDTDTPPASLKNRPLQLQTSSTQPTVYFEPGVTYHTQGFCIVNTGSIPINFRLAISYDEQYDMMGFASVFSFEVSTDSTGMGEFIPLTEYQGRLESGESTETLYLFIRMKETAGNGLQDYVFDEIGITVYAVQGNVSIEEVTNAKQ